MSANIEGARESADPRPVLVVRERDGGVMQSIGLDAGEVSIGRTSDNGVVLGDPERVISARHARLLVRDGRVEVLDTSRNGTWIEGLSTPLRYGDRRVIGSGDRIRIGTYVLEVRLPVASDGQRVFPIPVMDREPVSNGGALPVFATDRTDIRRLDVDAIFGSNQPAASANPPDRAAYVPPALASAVGDPTERSARESLASLVDDLLSTPDGAVGHDGAERHPSDPQTITGSTAPPYGETPGTFSGAGAARTERPPPAFNEPVGFPPQVIPSSSVNPAGQGRLHNDPAVLAVAAFWTGFGFFPDELSASELAPLMRQLGGALREACDGVEAMLAEPDAIGVVGDEDRGMFRRLLLGRGQSATPLNEVMRRSIDRLRRRQERRRQAVAEAAVDMAGFLSAEAIAQRYAGLVRSVRPFRRRAELWRLFEALGGEIRTLAIARFTEAASRGVGASGRALGLEGGSTRAPTAGNNAKDDAGR